jgi:hypothetical protein
MRSRVIAGRKAKQEGKGFENTLYVDALRQGWYVINIPQGCRWIGQNKVIAVESPFDFLIIKDGKTICLVLSDPSTSLRDVNHVPTLTKCIHIEGILKPLPLLFGLPPGNNSAPHT